MSCRFNVLCDDCNRNEWSQNAEVRRRRQKFIRDRTRTCPRSALFLANGVLCVNTLSAGQQAVSNAFSAPSDKADMASRFAAGEWGQLATGAPVLAGAAASFDCRITEVLEQGTHSVVFASVEAVRFADMEAGCLMYYARGYHGLPTGQ